MTENQHESRYRAEARIFVEIMRGSAPALRLDYSAASIEALERFIAAQFDPPGSHFVGEQLPIGVGCYVGEVIIRTLGGDWSADGRPEIYGVGAIQAIFPIQKALKRFGNGAEDSLAHYYATIARYARAAGAEQRR